ncbi:MAG: Gfo/Idh/MocA family oxidoreductase [Myxococcales bacterium]|nr:Gfo/Idh/MocA family oxidoreductase [Myxococcales bacterium]
MTQAPGVKKPAGRFWRWGILGTAQISTEIIRALRRSRNGILRAVASRNESKAREWARRYGIPLAFASYDEMLQSGEVDLIYNPLPTSLHAEWTMRALEAGLPVLCEKPFAANAVEARAVAARAAERGLPVAEAFMYRHHPQWARVAELVASGVIGEVSALHGQFTFLLDDRTQNPASAEMAGGALRDVGCYCVHFSRLIAGCEPSWVSAFEKRSCVDDLLLGLLEFPNGVLSHFETSIANFERHRAEIAGTAGALQLLNPWVPGDAPAVIRLLRPEAKSEEIVVPPADSYRLELDDFAAVCAGEIAPRWPAADAVANMAVLDALFASARERRAVSLP